MALAASRTLLALFVTFCAPGYGLTGKKKKKKKRFVDFLLSRCTVCTRVFFSLVIAFFLLELNGSSLIDDLVDATFDFAQFIAFYLAQM